MTRINDSLLVQYIDDINPTDDRVVFADDSTGSEFTINFDDVARVQRTLAYFVERHQEAMQR
jgi:hypothetical protein